MKYDKMIAVNKAESEQKIKKAIRAIDDMGARGLPISVTELVRWTGLSRGFFYKNVQVRQKLEEAIKQPRRIDVQQPSEERNAADYNFQELKKDFNSCQSEKVQYTSKRGGHIEETVGSKGNCIVKKTIKVVIKDEGK